jgi:DNA-binding transcriptional LysR family regulator
MVQALAEGFAAALADIIASWPWLELDLQVADSHTVSQKVRQADLDFGLILDPQGRPDSACWHLPNWRWGL